MVKQQKFKRLAGTIHTVVKIFFWAAVVGAIICALGSVVMSFLPADYFNAGNTRSLLLTIDGVIRYRLEPPLSPVSLKPIFLTILVSSSIGFGLLALIFRPLAGILKTVKEDQPFAAENANRLTNMGVVMLISSFLANVIQATVVFVIISTLNIPNIDVNYSLNLTMLLMGLLLLILAGVFRYGSYLQDEVDSTL